MPQKAESTSVESNPCCAHLPHHQLFTIRHHKQSTQSQLNSSRQQLHYWIYVLFDLVSQSKTMASDVRPPHVRHSLASFANMYRCSKSPRKSSSLSVKPTCRFQMILLSPRTGTQPTPPRSTSVQEVLRATFPKGVLLVRVDYVNLLPLGTSICRKLGDKERRAWRAYLKMPRQNNAF